MATSVKHNILANYVSQIYVMVISIVMAPVYLHYMGKEAYGLIGFFTMMAVCFQILDLGLTPTLIRETALFRGGAITGITLRKFLRVLEWFFGVVSLAMAAVMILCSDVIARQWLNVQNLSTTEVSNAVILIGLSIPLRWIASLYGSVVSGFERQVWLGGYSVFIATLRFVGILFVFFFVGASPVDFFSYQLVVALIELGGMATMTYHLIPLQGTALGRITLKSISSNMKFSFNIAFAAMVWVAITQADKLLLSKYLPLTQFGMFSIVVMAASAIMSISAPVARAIMPRLTKMVAENDTYAVTRLYERSTQFVSIFIAPATAVLCFFAGPILYGWTGDMSIADYGAPILTLYAFGMGFSVLSAFAFYIQFAKGDLKLHFWGQVLLLVSVVPSFVLLGRRFGGVGTGAVWALSNALYFFVWVPIVHKRMMRGMHWHWLTHDIAAVFVPTLFAGWMFSLLLPVPSGRWLGFFVVAVVGCVLLGVAIAASAEARTYLLNFGKKRI